MLLESNNLFRVQFFESCWKKASILWVMLKSVRFCGSNQKNSILCTISQKFNLFFGSYQTKSSILWVIFSKKKFNSLSHFRKNQFFESFGEKDVQFCASNIREKEMFNSVRQIEKEVQRFESISNLWVIFKKNSILWVTF